MSKIPPPCKPSVYASGALVPMTHTIDVEQFELWVQAISKVSGQDVDWHFAGGRACVLATGDLHRVRQTILDLKAWHDLIQSTKAATYYEPYGEPFEPYWTLYGPDEINPAHEIARQWNLETEPPATPA